MRTAFVKILIELAKKDDRICLLTGDLGFHALEEFREKFSERFFNCGIAEQNMAGLAAGLALCGKKPYIYSIVPFVTLRCLEQIRNDICYQNLDVKIIGIGGGFSYGTLGSTHSVMEELAILRVLPNMTVLCPADAFETEELISKSYQTENPTYIRITKADKASLHDQKPDLEIGKPYAIKEGTKTAIISTGPQIIFSIQAAKELKEKGYDIKIINIHTIKPIEKNSLLRMLEGIDDVFVFEEHSVMGGIGSAVLECLAETEWKGKVKIIGVPDEFSSCVGAQDYLRKKYAIDKEGIIKSILNEQKSK
jgi:transketolase